MTYTQPLLFVFGVVALLGVIRLRRCQGAWLAIVGVCGTLLLSWPPIDWLLSRPLEIWYPVKPYQPDAAQAIVVLASAVDPAHFERPFPVPDAEAFRRCEMAAWIHKSQPSLPVLVCGGPSNSDERPHSLFMKELLQRAGVPETMIWTEERSRNTHENVAYGANLLRKNGISRIVLVVDCASMLRASACFRKLGFAVTPAPSSYREWGPLRDELLPSWKAIYGNELTLHEGLGLLWYRIRGWI